MPADADAAVANTRLVLGPNASLTVRQAVWAFGGVATVAFLIAIGFALMGFWPVVPFAGLEVGALGAAFWVSMRRNRYREVLDFAADTVHIRFGESGGTAVASMEWPRAWTRVELAPGGNRLAHTQLRLRCWGQAVTLGRCLTDAEREQVHARIKQLLPPVWRMAMAGEPGPAPAASISNGE